MRRYVIAGLTFDLFPDFDDTLTEFEPYAINASVTPDVQIAFSGCSKIPLPKAKPFFTDYALWYRQLHAGNASTQDIYIPGMLNPDEILCKISIDKDWRCILITYLKDIMGIENAVAKLIGNIIMRNLILLHDGIVLHASAVKWHEKGIIFTAPSGTGKSTQADLWQTYMSADIINDDTPVLKLAEDKAIVHGTPWCGSDYTKHSNTSVKAEAIIVLEQSQRNTIRQLSGKELTAYLMPRFLLPYHDQHLMVLALTNISRLLDAIPVYLLQCRPDKDAVALVYESILAK